MLNRRSHLGRAANSILAQADRTSFVAFVHASDRWNGSGGRAGPDRPGFRRSHHGGRSFQQGANYREALAPSAVGSDRIGPRKSASRLESAPRRAEQEPGSMRVSRYRSGGSVRIGRDPPGGAEKCRIRCTRRLLVNLNFFRSGQSNRAILGAELVHQPRSCEIPVPLDRARRDPEYLGDFFFVQASKVAQFDHPSLTRCDLGKFVKRCVQGDDKMLWLG